MTKEQELLNAAAPDLLFELEGIVAFADGFYCYYHQGPAGKELRSWIEGARRAIAKAKGKNEMQSLPGYWQLNT